mmetsp:Transcript_24088/g.58176  ORF Transcript_24088/g.58176 Transcript_24088/m.58176 type:complete len:206 (-) Transcript_24088:1450-2067(-)
MDRPRSVLRKRRADVAVGHGVLGGLRFGELRAVRTGRTERLRSSPRHHGESSVSDAVGIVRRDVAIGMRGVDGQAQPRGGYRERRRADRHQAVHIVRRGAFPCRDVRRRVIVEARARVDGCISQFTASSQMRGYWRIDTDTDISGQLHIPYASDLDCGCGTRGTDQDNTAVDSRDDILDARAIQLDGDEYCWGCLDDDFSGCVCF